MNARPSKVSQSHVGNPHVPDTSKIAHVTPEIMSINTAHPQRPRDLIYSIKDVPMPLFYTLA